MRFFPGIYEAMVILNSAASVCVGNSGGSGGVPTCYSKNFFHAGIQGES